MMVEIDRLSNELEKSLSRSNLSKAAWRYIDSDGSLCYTNNPNEVWNNPDISEITVLYERN